MITKIKSKSIALYRNIIGSIWLIPSIISLLFFLLIAYILVVHSPQDEYKILNLIPYGEINNADTARALITTILAGTISLIIFSFTMMMFVLNQAASNYSSKVLGGLISQRSNQVVLGFYIGNIIYSIILLIQIKDDERFDEVPHIGIFIAVIIFIICIILFVKFINDIYDSVQIYSVIKRIHDKTKKRLNKEAKFNSSEYQVLSVKEWFENASSKSGYFQAISRDALLGLACENDLVIQVIPPKGFYQTTGAPFFRLSKKITDKELLNEIEEGLLTYPGESIDDNSLYGLRQLSEIALQALSTGINAPGTAIACLDYLADLFCIRIQQDNSEIIFDEKKQMRVCVPDVSLAELFEICISPIRIYGKKDVNIILSLLNFIKRLSYNDKNQRCQSLLIKHVLAIFEDGMKGLTNSMDKEAMKSRIRELRNMPSNYFLELNLQPYF